MDHFGEKQRNSKDALENLTEVEIVHAIGHENVVKHAKTLAFCLGEHVNAAICPRHIFADAVGDGCGNNQHSQGWKPISNCKVRSSMFVAFGAPVEHLAKGAITFDLFRQDGLPLFLHDVVSSLLIRSKLGRVHGFRTRVVKQRASMRVRIGAEDTTVAIHWRGLL